MKSRILRYLAVFCAVSIALSCLTWSGAAGDEPVGRMASVYAYTLNDYIFTYGTLRTENAGDTFRFDEGNDYPTGVIYSEIVNFDANENPYLVIFLADAEYAVASCHVWSYNEEKDCSERIAILDVQYSKFADGQVGTFSLGYNGDKRYVIYREYQNDIETNADYYTAIDGEAFKYVKEQTVPDEIGVMDFSKAYFHPNVDISRFNLNLNQFFDKLKNTAADSVTHEDIAPRLRSEDEEQIEAVLKSVTGLTDFDIANYSTMEEYQDAIAALPFGDRFYLISEAYDLGDGIYYIRFSTDRSYYNYALLRRSEDAENGYQILKVRTDCIPLSDRELKQIKTDYDRNTLLYKKTRSPLKLLKHAGDEEKDGEKPFIQFNKSVDTRLRLPVICIGGGIALALLTILWVYLYSDKD